MLQQVTKLDPYQMLLVSVSVLLIYFHSHAKVHSIQSVVCGLQSALSGRHRVTSPCELTEKLTGTTMCAWFLQIGIESHTTPIFLLYFTHSLHVYAGETIMPPQK